jgi:hypothetical protein
MMIITRYQSAFKRKGEKASKKNVSRETLAMGVA